MDFIHYCVLVLAISTASIFKQTQAVVLGGAAPPNDWLAEAECQAARVPETCMQCLNSDHRIGNVENSAGVATIVVGCVSSHADNLVQEMTQLAASNHDQVSGQPLEECCTLLGSAKKEVVAATEKIDKYDYEGADKSMDSALTYAMQCYQQLDEAYKKSPTTEPMIPESVMSEMMVHEQLCEAAIRIIDRCKY